MRCTLIRWWMDEYIDGRLSGKRLEWVQTHLRTCRACQQELRWRRSLRDTLKISVPVLPPQEMWQEFQQRLSQRTPRSHPSHITWWQVGTATAALACAVMLGVLWRTQKLAPVPTSSAPSRTHQEDYSLKADRFTELPSAPLASGGSSFSTLPPQEQSEKADSRWAQGVKAPAKSRPRAPSPPHIALRYAPVKTAAQTPSEPAPQATISVAYAEVRSASGELVGKVLLQTTYDEAGQPKAVQIEMNSPAVVEVETYEQPMDNIPDSNSNTRGSADGTMPAAGAPLGISD